MKLVIRFILLYITVIAISCSRPDPGLIRAEGLIEQSPDSALAIIDGLTLHTNVDYALKDILKVKIFYGKGVGMNADSILNFAIQHYTEHPDGNRLASCYFLKGRIYKKNMMYEKAMDYYLKAKDKITDNSDYQLLGRLNLDVGEILYAQSDYDNARNKFLIANDYFNKADMQPQSFSCKMMYGLCYKDEKRYSIADKYFKKVLKMAKDTMQAGLILQEIAYNFNRWGKLDSSLMYYRKLIHYPNYENNYSIRYYQLSDLFFQLNQLDSAIYYANASFRFQPDVRTRRGCYRVLVNSKAIQGDLKALSKYMVLYQDCTDSIRKIDAQTKVTYIESIHESRREVDATRYILWYVMTILFIVIVISVVVYGAKHRKSLTERQQAEQQKHQQKTDLRLEVVTRSREALQQTIALKRKEIAATLKKYASDDAKADERKKVISQLYAELIHFNDKHFFRKEMNTIMNQLYNKLESRYPELKEKEIEWACLYMLKVPTEDILFLLDYNTEALKKMKQRFAKKIGVQLVSEIEPYLKSILSE